MELSRPISPGTSRRISSALVIFVAISAIRVRHRGRVVVFAVMGSSVSHAACARSQARKRGPLPPRGFPRRASQKRARDASSPSARRYREHQRSPSRSARARRVSGPRFLAERATDSRSSPVPTPEGLTAWGSAGSGPWMPVSGIHCADLRQKNVLGEAKGGLMKTHRPITSGIAFLFLVALTAGSSGGGRAAAAAATMFSGQATVLSGTVAGIPITLVDTGPVAASGGHLHQSVLEYPINGLPAPTGGAPTA